MEVSQDEQAKSQVAALNQIQRTLQSIQYDYRQLSATVEAIDRRVNLLPGAQKSNGVADSDNTATGSRGTAVPKELSQSMSSSPSLIALDDQTENPPGSKSPIVAQNSKTPSRIVLTTYPGQSGIDPMVMRWGRLDPKERGPVVVSRSPSTIRRRNGMSLSLPIRRPFVLN